MFSTGYGFILDYLAEILRYLRSYDYSNKYQEYFELSSDISTRDRDGINKTFSGLMKVLFPSGSASKTDLEMLLEFAAEGRKRVKDQLMRIDNTYPEVSFSYTDLENNKDVPLKTKEEQLFPQHYFNKGESHTRKSNIDTLDKPPKRIETKLSEEEKLIQSGENSKLEFKSTMRWNILAGRIDKEIEHGVLKTIVALMNSEGGILLVGVKDDGSICGLDADQFENDDKYLLHFANLINEKIGKQFIDQIDYGLRVVGTEKILHVECKPSSNPVFLKNNGLEEFYVRNGPSSVQLSTSQFHEYSKKHFR
jgi:hypothetical protein